MDLFGPFLDGLYVLHSCFQAYRMYRLQPGNFVVYKALLVLYKALFTTGSSCVLD